MTPEKVESYDEDEYQKQISEIRQKDKAYDKQFMSNHGEQVNWNKGTLDVNKYRDKLQDIEEASSQMELSKHLINKKAQAMTYKIEDDQTQKYN